MTITLELKPEVEARAKRQAGARGVSVEDYLRSVIERILKADTDHSFYETASIEEWEAALDEIANSSSLTNAPVLSDEDISRESIYCEREDSQL